MSMRSFERADFVRRLTALQERLQERNLDVAIITRPQNIFYLTGFRGSHFSSNLSEHHSVVVPVRGAPRLITRALERGVAQLQWAPDPVLYMDHENPYAALAKVIADYNLPIRNVGIEERFLSIRQMNRIAEFVRFEHVHDISGFVERLAAVPSEVEIASIKRAAEVTRAGFKAGIAAIAVGKYPYQVVGAIHEAMYSAGQSDFDMSMVCVWGGETGGRMHDTITTEQIQAGDAVTIEIFGIDNHYKVGAQGTVFAGRAPERPVQESYATLVAMFEAGRQSLRAGVKSGDVFAAANKPYRARWDADYYRKVGGTMGLSVFETPLLKGGDAALPAGACVLLQTLVDDPVLLTCSSSVLITDDGFETLTDPIKEITVV
jgi:Xaa-Pro dipeptidase